MDIKSLGHTKWNCKFKNQLQEDIASDQISLKEYTDPFTGEPIIKKNKK